MRYSDSIDFARLSYSELRPPYAPTDLTLRMCVGKQGRHMIAMTKLSGVKWIYWQSERGVFEIYGDHAVADFERAKEMLRCCLAFAALRRRPQEQPASAEELQWAVAHVKSLPTALSEYRIRAGSPGGAPPPLLLSEETLRSIDAAVRTSDWLPVGYTVRFDSSNYTMSYVERRGDAYDIRASDDHALHTTTTLLHQMLLQRCFGLFPSLRQDLAVGVHGQGQPTDELPLSQHQLYTWAYQFASTYA